MSFKNKNKKVINCNNNITLESKHNYLCKNLKDKNYLEEEKQVLLELESRLEECKHNHIEEINVIKDQIIDQKEKIEKYINNYDNNNEIQYLLNNGQLIFDYYDIQDNNNNIIQPEKDTNTYDTNNSITKYFINDNNGNIQFKKNNRINNIVTNFLINTKDNFEINFNNYKYNIDYCENCNTNKIVYLSDGINICPKCGEESEILIESEKPSYKDPPREITYFSYKRINHFNEWLAQFQAKETTDIPHDIYDQILNEIKKERIDVTKLKSHKLRQILKKIGKNKYYEHIPHILTKISGKKPPIMSAELEEELRRMFKEIQIPFYKFCPKNRKNFLSYSYVLHKFVELLGYNQYTNCFLLLKSREKLHQQDMIWKDICKYLKWEFISSI